MAGRSSYFAERREQNQDPNFFNRMSLDEIRKNVKRIIRDAKYNIITDQDYMYFKNPQVLQACINESYDNHIAASVIANGLSFYINEGLNKGVRLYPSLDVRQENMVAANVQIENNTRAMLWLNLYMMFCDISNGKDPKEALKYVQLMTNRDMALL